MAAAIATGAFALVTNTIWQLADLLGAPRLTSLMILSISSMVFWIITQHDLWESPRRDDPVERYKASLYNTSTVWSLMIGVVMSYVLLFAAVLLGAAGNPVGVRSDSRGGSSIELPSTAAGRSGADFGPCLSAFAGRTLITSPVPDRPGSFAPGVNQ